MRALAHLVAGILALAIVGCGGGDDDPGVDAGGVDASLADYSEENCDSLFGAPQVQDMNCCYSGGFQPACGDDVAGNPMRDVDGVFGCIDQMVSPEAPVPKCAYFECETIVGDVSECE